MAKKSNVALISQRPSVIPDEQPGTHCAVCGDRLIQIDMTIDGEAVAMVSCSICDRRSWRRGGHDVELREILIDLSALPIRYRRNARLAD